MNENDTKNRPNGIRCTVLELTKPKNAGKNYRLRPDGTVEKWTEGMVVTGTARVKAFEDVDAFAQFLLSLRPGREVLIYGVPVLSVDDDGVPVVTRETLKQRAKDAPPAIARSREHFAYAKGPGLLAFDYDPRSGTEAESEDALLDVLATVAAPMKDVVTVWWPSSSSHVYMPDGKPYTGLKGQRFWVGVEEASDIPRAAEAILVRSWLKGFGYILVSDNGALLVRGTFDPCMYQPERIDYAGGAVLHGGLKQDRGKPVVFGDDDAALLLDSRRDIPDLTPEERAEFGRLVAAAKADKEGEAKEKRENWIDRQIEKIAETELVDEGDKRPSRAQVRERVGKLTEAGERERLRDLLRDDQRIVLPLDARIWLDGSRYVTVREVLEHPVKWEGVTCCDPIEPTYRDNAKTGILYSASGRVLVSQAHGIQRVYALGSDEDAAGITTARYREVMASWMDHVRSVEETLKDDPKAALDDDAMEWLALLSEHDEAGARIEDAFRKARRLTNLRNVEKRQKSRAKAEAQAMGGNEDALVQTARNRGHLPFWLDRASRYMARRGELVGALVANGRAYRFNDLPVAICRRPSAFAMVPQRDERGNLLRDAEGEVIKEPAMTTKAVVYSQGLLRGDLHGVAQFLRHTESGDTADVEVPGSLVNTLLADMESEGHGLPVIAAIATHPVYRNGKLLLGRGYDPDSKLWLDTGHIDIEEWHDARAAYRWLVDDWLSDFPFDHPADAARAVALLMSMLAMPGVEASAEAGPPSTVITATRAGTGKTLLGSGIAEVVQGAVAKTVGLPKSEEEMEKILVASLLEGDGYLMFDNVPRGKQVGSAQLMRYITSARYDGRVLGVSKMANGYSMGHIILTGNNVGFAGDGQSRALNIRLMLDPDTNSMTRTFRREFFLKDTQALRGKIIGAAVAILKAEGEPVAAGRFPIWERLVAEPLHGVSGVDITEPWRDAGGDCEEYEGDDITPALQAVWDMHKPEGNVVELVGQSTDWLIAKDFIDANGAHAGEFGTETSKLLVRADQKVNPANVAYNLNGLHGTRFGDFVLYCDKRNLGVRTHRKVKPVYRLVWKPLRQISPDEDAGRGWGAKVRPFQHPAKGRKGGGDEE